MVQGLGLGLYYSGGGGGSTPFVPTDLGADLLAWYDFTDAATITGNPNVTAVADKSTNARNLTGTNNPQWDGSKITFNGTSNYLSRTSAFMYDNGGVMAFIVVKSNGTSGGGILNEGSSAGGNPQYVLSRVNNTNANDEVYGFIRNDANTTVLNSGNSLCSTVYDDTKKIVLIRDTGSMMFSYVNGYMGPSSQPYTRSATTVNRFAIGAIVRNTVSGYLAMELSEVVIIDSDCTVAQINQVQSYLSAKHSIAVTGISILDGTERTVAKGGYPCTNNDYNPGYTRYERRSPITIGGQDVSYIQLTYWNGYTEGVS